MLSSLFFSTSNTLMPSGSIDASLEVSPYWFTMSNIIGTALSEATKRLNFCPIKSDIAMDDSAIPITG